MSAQLQRVANILRDGIIFIGIVALTVIVIFIAYWGFEVIFSVL